jgi:acyl carrier protein
MERAVVTDMVVKCLEEILQQDGQTPERPIDGSAQLVGQDSLLDSLGLVRLIADVEQRLHAEHEILVTLADERAMSQKNSPFRSVSALADYICLLAEEQHGHARA